MKGPTKIQPRQSFRGLRRTGARVGGAVSAATDAIVMLFTSLERPQNVYVNILVFGR